MLPRGRGQGTMPDDDADRRELRRLALQLSVQLPSDQADALYVLRQAERLVTGFLARDDDPGPPTPPTPLKIVR